MARGKKKEENLTLEEKLEQALVPEEEWPYEVPGNWCWVRLKDVCIFERGITFPASAKEYEQTADNIACLRTANIQEDLDMDNLIYVGKKNMKNNKSKFVKEDDIIMSSANSRELVGKVVYVDSVPYPMTFGGFVLTIRTNQLLSKFIYYFLRLEFLLGRFMAESTQTTNIANINTTILGGYPFPIPPLSEQKCIVERIESLFYKVDEVKEKIQYVLESSENRKAAILHKAFSGELTAQWRKHRGVSFERWITKPLSEVATLQTGLMKGKRNNQKTVLLPYLRVANVQDGYLDLKEIKNMEVDALKIERYRLKKGDVLFTEGGDFDKLGRGSVWNEEIPDCIHQNHIFVVRTQTDTLDPYFLSLQAGSRYGKTYFISCSKQTTNLASINSTQLKKFPVLIPSIEEQREIVNILNFFLDEEEQIKQNCLKLLEKIEEIKKSILSRAFRGELGTNNPDEESAIELLKTIL